MASSGWPNANGGGGPPLPPPPPPPPPGAAGPYGGGGMNRVGGGGGGGGAEGFFGGAGPGPGAGGPPHAPPPTPTPATPGGRNNDEAGMKQAGHQHQHHQQHRQMPPPPPAPAATTWQQQKQHGRGEGSGGSTARNQLYRGVANVGGGGEASSSENGFGFAPPPAPAPAGIQRQQQQQQSRSPYGPSPGVSAPQGGETASGRPASGYGGHGSNMPPPPGPGPQQRVQQQRQQQQQTSAPTPSRPSMSMPPPPGAPPPSPHLQHRGGAHQGLSSDDSSTYNQQQQQQRPYSAPSPAPSPMPSPPPPPAPNGGGIKGPTGAGAGGGRGSGTANAALRNLLPPPTPPPPPGSGPRQPQGPTPTPSRAAQQHLPPPPGNTGTTAPLARERFVASGPPAHLPGRATPRRGPAATPQRQQQPQQQGRMDAQGPPRYPPPPGGAVPADPLQQQQQGQYQRYPPPPDGRQPPPPSPGGQRQYPPPPPQPQPQPPGQSRQMPPPPPPGQMQMQQQQQYPPPPGQQQQYPPPPGRQQQQYPPPPPGQQHQQQQPHVPPHPQQPGPPQQQHPAQGQPQQRQPQQQQQQQQPQQQQQQQQRAGEPTQKIDPSQIPRIPCHTRPQNHKPADIYFPRAALHLPTPDPYAAQGSSSNDSTGGGGSVSGAPTSGGSVRPPPERAFGRYVSVDDGNAGPRTLRCTTYAFPINRNVTEKTKLPLAVCCTPFLPPNGVEPSVVAGSDDGTGDGSDTRDGQGQQPGEGMGVPILPYRRGGEPVRCVECGAYLNPFALPTGNHSTSFSTFDCNFCGHDNDSTVNYHEALSYSSWGAFAPDLAGKGSEGEIGLDTMESVETCTRYAVVDHVVGGRYEVREARRPTHVYAVDVSTKGEVNLSEVLRAIKAVAHALAKDWIELERDYLDTVSQATSGLRKSVSFEDGHHHGRTTTSVDGERPPLRPRVGLFLYDDTAAYFPHWKSPRRRRSDGDDDGGGDGNVQVEDEDSGEGELCLAVVSDVSEDPFCPLPPHAFCHDVTSPAGMRRLDDVLNGIPSLVESAVRGRAGAKEDPNDDRSAGGAALGIISDALRDTGGRGILVASSRPSLGVGALRRRERPPPSANSRGVIRGGSRGGGPAEAESWLPLQLVPDKMLQRSAGSEAKVDLAAKEYYTKLGRDCGKSSVSVDVVCLTRPPSNMAVREDEPYFDVATLGEFCRVTSGCVKVVRMPPVADGDDDEKVGDDECPLTQELLRTSSSDRNVGQDAVFKLRCSEGIRIKSFLGQPPGMVVENALTDESELELSRCGSDTCVVVSLEHKVGGLSRDRPCAYFQSAVLYTTPCGQRRVRVATLAVRTTSHVQDVFRAADYGTIAAVLTRNVVADMRKCDAGDEDEDGEVRLATARKKVVEACVDILSSYRMNTSAKKSPAGQLILPETLQLLPIFCLSIKKSTLLRRNLNNRNLPTAHPTGDERALHAFHSDVVPPELTTLLVHPSMCRLDDMKAGEGYVVTPTAQPHARGAPNSREEDAAAAARAAACRPYVQLPPTVQPSISCLEDEGVYLLDDGFALYLYVGRNVSPDVRMELFGTDRPKHCQVVSPSSDFGRRVNNVVRQVRGWSPARPTFAPVVVVLSKEGGVGGGLDYSAGQAARDDEERMMGLLVDDATMHEKGYVDFLCSLHKQIRFEMQQARS